MLNKKLIKASIICLSDKAMTIIIYKMSLTPLAGGKVPPISVVTDESTVSLHVESTIAAVHHGGSATVRLLRWGRGGVSVRNCWRSSTSAGIYVK